MSRATEWAKEFKNARAMRPTFALFRYGKPRAKISVNDDGALLIETDFDPVYPMIAKSSLTLSGVDVADLASVLTEWYSEPRVR